MSNEIVLPPTESTAQIKEYKRIESLTNGMMGEIFTILDASYGTEFSTTGMTLSGTTTGVSYVKSKGEAVKDLIKQSMWRRVQEYATHELGATTIE